MEHRQFLPVLEWVIKGKGKIIYGGTTYKDELKLLSRYLRILMELEKDGKVVRMPDDRSIDEYEVMLKIRIPEKDFDDPHIVALVAISQCRIVCTNDRRAHPYLQDKALYPKGVKPPKIYSSARHVRLCCDNNIASICKCKSAK
jgi:hypothetical protein